jgi:hypothetical protein
LKGSKHNRISFEYYGDTVTPGANLGFAENFSSLSGLPDILLEDGKRAYLKRIRFFLRCESTGPFGIIPVAVQTAGTFADTANLADQEVQDLLDGAIDDTFGFEPLADFFVAKRMAPDANNMDWVVERSFEVPRHLLNLKNKEGETERLQEIYLGVVGQTRTNVDITFYIGRIAEFTAINRSIAIR